jgi:hypothetical protein
MVAAISATQARNPITLRNIRAVINRCPIGGTPYRVVSALAMVFDDEPISFRP